MTSEPTLFRIFQFAFSPDWRLAEHSHSDFNEMVIPIGGCIETRIAGQTISGRAGSVLVYPKGFAHAERAVGCQPLRLLYLSFTGTWDAEVPLVRHGADRRYEFLARWILDAQDDPAMQHLLLQALLAHYRRPCGEPDDAVARVKAHVREHLNEPMQLADLAEVAGLSPFHFARLFRARTGLAPMRHVRRARVEAVRTLLLTTAMPLRAIAPMVGLKDEFELSRVFKRETGSSPSEARRQVQI